MDQRANEGEKILSEKFVIVTIIKNGRIGADCRGRNDVLQCGGTALMQGVRKESFYQILRRSIVSTMKVARVQSLARMSADADRTMAIDAGKSIL